CFSALGVDVFATAGTLVAAGAGAASCAGGAADADESSMPMSHAAPIAGARPNAATAVATNIFFMSNSSRDGPIESAPIGNACQRAQGPRCGESSKRSTQQRLSPSL